MVRWKLLVAVLTWISLLPACAAGQSRSPFDAVRWVKQGPEVRVGEDWYEFRGIEGARVDDILTRITQRWGSGSFNKRFTEDLMDVLQDLDVSPGDTVSLQLVRLSDGAELTLDGVPNTSEKRQLLWARNKGLIGPTTLTREALQADLELFVDGLQRRFAYVELRDIDLQAAVADIAASLPADASVADVARELDRLLNRFGDGHARVSAATYEPSRVGPFLPFLLADSEAGVVAFEADRSGFLDVAHPRVLSIDGIPVDDCLASVAADVTAGSPQLVRHRSLRWMRNYGLWRPRLEGASAATRVPIELASLDGQRTRTLEVELSQDKPIFGPWPRLPSQELAGGSVGYLRLASMNDAAVDEVHEAMDAFRDTRGLVVDVRGNGGGSRQALIALAGYLTDPDDGPWVGNVAAYRQDEFPADHLGARFMERADSTRLTPAEVEAIARLAARFRPEWTLPEGFSDWHYLVLGPTGDGDEYHYTGDVVVLSDAACFSATDIFLGALERLPQVTLLGAPSGGGSARRQDFVLPNSRIEVSCASMASFRPDGRLYDTRGIEVDVELADDPTYVLNGGTDRVLTAAVERLGG